MQKAKLQRYLLLLPLLFLGSGAFCQDDAIGKFFGKYLDDSRFSVVSISPKMFRLLSKIKWDTIPADVQQTVTRLTSLRILSTDATPMVFYKEALAAIDRKQYEDLITVRGNKDNVRFMIRDDGKVIHELLMISVGEDGFSMMSFVGDIDLDKLSRLSTDMGIKGMENLKNVKRK